MKAEFKVVVNGHEYHSLDEMPEQLRSLVKDAVKTGVKQALTNPGATQLNFKKSFKLRLGEDAAPLEMQPPIESPEEYRLSMQMRQGGSVPDATAWEPALTVALVLVAFATVIEWIRVLKNPEVLGVWTVLAPFVPLLLSILGLAWVWNRRQRRELYSVLQDLALRMHGAFVVLVRGNPVLHFARDGWNGTFVIRRGSDDTPTCSLIEAQIQPSRARLTVRSRVLLDSITRLFGVVPPDTGNGEFDRGFSVSADDPGFAGKILDHVLVAILVRLGGFGRVALEIKGNLVRISVERNLAVMRRRSRREEDAARLGSFLTDAAAVVDHVARLTTEETGAPGKDMV
jgi:hypothetical protein